MRRTLRAFTALSILASSLLFTHSASAIGTLYSVGTGSGDVACTTSGWFSISNNSVYPDSNNCRGTANIPLGVTSIGFRAFYNVPLSGITIPSTVTSIGEQAFTRSTLTSIIIPNNVLSIGPNIFQNTNYLTSVTLGNGITSIPDRAFEHSHALTSVNIPSNVRSIGYGAFWAAIALTSVTIPDGVETVGQSAFQDMLELQSLVIGSGVTSIGSIAFSGNLKLLSYRYCGTGVNASTLTSAGLGSKTRLACPAVITAGTEPNSQVVTFPSGVLVAEIPASSSLPAMKVAFAATAPQAVTVIPTTNSAPLSATPFMTSGSLKIVDIQIANHDGSDVTVCLEGASTDLLYHYTAGEWVELRERSYTNGQVCGITNSFSLFAAAPAKPISAVSLTTDKAAAEAEAKRVAEQVATRTEIVKSFQSSQNVDAQTFAKAGISGITNSNISEVNAEILALPQESQGDLGQILKIARKYEVVGNIASENVVRVFPKTFVEVGLIPVDSPNKCLLSMAVRRLAPSDRDSFAEIKAAIDAEMALINARAIRLAALLAR
ncbi:MAG: hypothetical protein RL130_1111 [Actinomycetota bacterium]|jgi:hypothetical protein